MFVFVDECGSFTESTTPDSWCVVAAYALPENQVSHVSRVLKRIRAKNGGTETKLPQLHEADYFEFLHRLSGLPGLGFTVACDVSLHTREAVNKHRDAQVGKILEHIDKMHHETGRRGIERLASDVGALPFQLYAQLVLQVCLFDEVLLRAPLYYAQRRPHALARLRWRLDRKDTRPTAYEGAFHRLLPALLQSSSLRDPMVMLSEGADYSFFKRFDFEPGRHPEYLERDYGIHVGDGANLGMMIREDFELVDSAEVDGVQVADLLAAGVRRLLRGGFANQEVAARLLGGNMAGTIYNVPPVRLSTLGREAPVNGSNARLLSIMAKSAKALLRQ